MNLEQIAKEIVIDHGRFATEHNIWDAFGRHGINDENGELFELVLEAIENARITVKIGYIG